MSEFKFPTEEVDLPSKGLIYPKDHPLSSGKVEIKYMTAKEEDILSNQSFIQKGIVLEKLLRSVIISKDINVDDLIIGDKNAVLIAARILGYGKDYTFNFNGEEKTIDLTEVKDLNLDESLIKEGKNEFEFQLPTSKVLVTFKLLTHGDEQKIDKEIKGLKRLNKNISYDLSTRMKYIITSIDRDTDTKVIREFVDNQLLARDSRELRNYISKIQPNVDLTFEYESRNGDLKTSSIPVGLNFFWPDAQL